jgi:hypothetical protein
VDEVGHFAGGDVVVGETGVFGGALLEVAVEGAHGFAEEHVGVALAGAVGVELDEDPLGAAFDVDVAFLPKIEALGWAG